MLVTEHGPESVPEPQRGLKYVVAILRGQLSNKSYEEMRTLIHDMFDARMSDTSYTRDVTGPRRSAQTVVEIRGYKIFWLAKQLTRRYSRHFEGLELQRRGTDLIFADPQGPRRPQQPQKPAQSPDAPRVPAEKQAPKSAAPPWRGAKAAPPPWRVESSSMGPSSSQTASCPAGRTPAPPHPKPDGPARKNIRPTATASGRLPPPPPPPPPPPRQMIRLSEMLPTPNSGASAASDPNRYVFHFHMSG